MAVKRKLGLSETYLRFCHTDAGGTTDLAAMLRISGPLTEHMVEETLVCLQKRHPLLRAVLVEHDGKDPYLAIDREPSAVPLRIIKRKRSEQWKDVYDEYLNNPFVEGRGYLWQATLLIGGDKTTSEHELVVSFHHVIIDGISMGVFFKDFVHYLGNIEAGKTKETQELPLLPPIESLLEKQITWTQYVKGGQTGYMELVELQNELFEYEKHVPLASRRTRNFFLKIEKEPLSQMLNACRENRTTLTGLLSAALLLAAHQSFSDGQENGKREHIAFTPVNMRKRCNPEVSMHNLGCFISAVRTTHTIDENASLWQLARSFNKKLGKSIEDQGWAPAKYNRKKYIEMISGLDKGFLERRFHLGVGISNYGIADIPTEYKSFSVKEFYSGAARHWGDWLMLVHAATFGGMLSMCFCYEEPLVSHARAKSIFDECVSIINGL